MISHSGVTCPAITWPSMEIKTAFDVARPRPIAKPMGDRDVHGWITKAVQREISVLEETGNLRER